jgi:hypothetical protein
MHRCLTQPGRPYLTIMINHAHPSNMLRIPQLFYFFELFYSSKPVQSQPPALHYYIGRLPNNDVDITVLGGTLSEA